MAVADYWNRNIHDMKVAGHAPGTKEFFDEIYDYHFRKLSYLPTRVRYSRFRDKKVLGVGCGIGIDLLRFAENYADVTGIDVAGKAIDLAKKNFSLHNKLGRFMVMDAENMDFKDSTFDAVFAHGVVQYTPDPKKLIDEVYRVLRPGGIAMISVYNKHSWLYALYKLTGTGLEHRNAPYFHVFTKRQMEKYCQNFSKVSITTRRFPEKTLLHKGLKAKLFNNIFIPLTRLLPRKLWQRYGWHLVVEAKR